MIIILLSALIVFVGPVRGLTCYNCPNNAGCTTTIECTTSFCTIYFAESVFSYGCTDTQKSNDCTMLETAQDCTCNTPRCNTITPRPSTVTTTTAITSSTTTTSAGVTAAQTSFTSTTMTTLTTTPTTAISSKASAESLSTAYIILLVAVNAIILGSCGLIACCVYKNRERLVQLDSDFEDDKEN
ncbi:hypothetical protein HELRODRAFT_163565 [Helobdella robusta]|uniref:Uncharacterized protein n=1 Tax=Helobdella robusta TaxID=6412 RepID=T1EU78_HELRO|nr:hypothetical protein HELRODRAFT_163565 [Helobdella robusta]ESN96497.1 hypothetical protein HELRODRAFT_163565 [Helobdella robusta]